MVQLAAVYSSVVESGADLWAVSPQDRDSNARLRESRDLPFPILSDEHQAVIRAWGIYNHLDPKVRPIPHPATYILGSDGRVKWMHLGESTRDRPTPGAVVAALREITPATD